MNTDKPIQLVSLENEVVEKQHIIGDPFNGLSDVKVRKRGQGSKFRDDTHGKYIHPDQIAKNRKKNKQAKKSRKGNRRK